MLEYPEISAVDRLAEIRRQLRKLRQEAQGLRRQILAGTVSHDGHTHVAYVHQHVTLVPREPVRRAVPQRSPEYVY